MKHHHHHHRHGHLDDPARDEWQKPAELVAVMELAAGMIVADVGAGPGYFEPHLLGAVGDTGRVLALDANAELVAQLRHRYSAQPNLEARQISSSDPAIAEASVDRILVVDAWHHLEDRVEYAKRLRRALKSGGRLCVVDRPHDSPHAPPEELRLSASTVLAELSAAGFDASVVMTLPNQFVVLTQPR